MRVTPEPSGKEERLPSATHADVPTAASPPAMSLFQLTLTRTLRVAGSNSTAWVP
mgnify:CR=1 FL=1